MDAALPRLLWEDVDAVARPGADGLERGRTVVVPGAANWAASMLACVVPDRVLASLVERRHPGLYG